MDFRVREAGPADFEAVRGCMDEVFRETAGQKVSGFDRALWEWQYLGTELPSLIVIAETEAGLCGYYHSLRFRMRLQGRPARAAMVQDVGTLSAYRGRGVFREMGGFALERLRADGVDFIYTFPNARSLPSFVRNHHYRIVARVPVYLAPLDLGALLAGRFRLGAAGPWLGRALDPVVRAVTARSRALDPGEEILRLDRVDEELAQLATDFTHGVPVGLVRDLRYLRWRFLEKPAGGYTVWALARNGRPSAYLVSRSVELFGSRTLLIMDLGAREGEVRALRRLIRGRLEAERAGGSAAAVVMGLHPVFSSLGRLGFVRVPERFNPRPFNLLTHGLAMDDPVLGRPSAWHITLADWDVF